MNEIIKDEVNRQQSEPLTVQLIELITFECQVLDLQPPPTTCIGLVGEKESSKNCTWVLQLDGSASARQSGNGIYLRSPEEAEMEYAVSLWFKLTNNEAEYEAFSVA